MIGPGKGNLICLDIALADQKFGASKRRISANNTIYLRPRRLLHFYYQTL